MLTFNEQNGVNMDSIEKCDIKFVQVFILNLFGFA